MFKVVNISRKVITIAGVKIKSYQSYNFNYEDMSSLDTQKLENYEKLGLIKVLSVVNQNKPNTISINETETIEPKKVNTRKSNK